MLNNQPWRQPCLTIRRIWTIIIIIIEIYKNTGVSFGHCIYVFLYMWQFACPWVTSALGRFLEGVYWCVSWLTLTKATDDGMGSPCCHLHRAGGLFLIGGCNTRIWPEWVLIDSPVSFLCRSDYYGATSNHYFVSKIRSYRRSSQNVSWNASRTVSFGSLAAPSWTFVVLNTKWG